MALGGGGGPGGRGVAATRGGRGRAVDGRRADGVAAEEDGRRDSRGGG